MPKHFEGNHTRKPISKSKNLITKPTFSNETYLVMKKTKKQSSQRLFETRSPEGYEDFNTTNES